jgi:hypothetical protein
MVKLAAFVGSTIGGYIGWALGDRIGLMTAFILSMLGTGLGMYYGAKIAREYEG